MWTMLAYFGVGIIAAVVWIYCDINHEANKEHKDV